MGLKIEFGRWPFVFFGQDRGNPPDTKDQESIKRGVNQAKAIFRREFGEDIDKKILERVLEPVKVRSHDDFVKISGDYSDRATISVTSRGRLTMNASAFLSENYAFEAAYRGFLAKLLVLNNMAFFQYSPNFTRGTIEYLVRQATIKEKGLYRPGTYEPQIDVVVRLIKGGVSEDLWKKSLHNERALGELEGRINEVMGNEKGFEELEKVMNGPDRRRIDRMLPPPV